MENSFFVKPILNSPYEYPSRHWELDDSGQPTQSIIEDRREAQFLTPIPKPKKRKKPTATQMEIAIPDEHGISSEQQQYHTTETINSVRDEVDRWREIKDPKYWGVTPETERLLKHWRNHKFSGLRPFFCQIEAVETVIWLTEVAPQTRKG